MPRALLAACTFVFAASRPGVGPRHAGRADRDRGPPRAARFRSRVRAFTGSHDASTGFDASGHDRSIPRGGRQPGDLAAAFVRYPGLVSGPGTWVAVGVFSSLIALYVVAAARLGAPMLDHHLLRTAAVAGAVIAASWLAIGLEASEQRSKALSTVLLGLGPLVGLAIGWHATAGSGSTRVGMRCVGITALVAGFALFLLWAGEAVVTAGRPYDPALLRDFSTSGTPDLATYAVNDSLGTGMMLLLLVPLVSVVTGLVGAAVAARLTVIGRSWLLPAICRAVPPMTGPELPDAREG